MAMGARSTAAAFVAHPLGEDRGQQVEGREHRHGPQEAHLPDGEIGHQPGGAALLHRDAQREDAGEQEDDLPVHRLVGLLQVERAGEDESDAAEQGGDQNRQHVERGEPHDQGDDGQHDGRLAPPQARLVDGLEHDQVLIVVELPDLRLGSLDEQGVAQLQVHAVELLQERLPPPLDGQHQALVPAAEVQALEGLADEPRMRRDQCLHQLEVLGLEGLVLELELDVELELGRPPQLHQLLDLAPDQQDVPRFERLAQRRPDLLLAVEQAQHGDVVLFSEAAFLDRLADQRRALDHPQLGDVLAEAVGRGQLLGLALGEQPAAEEEEEEEAGDEQDQPHPAELEHAEGAVAGLVGDGAYEQVGGGADQGAHAAELRGVGEGDQQLRSGDPAAGGDDHDQRDEHRHRRGVVDERRQHADGAHHQHQGEEVVPAEAHQEPADPPQRAGLL
jgi:hypothetical protein